METLRVMLREPNVLAHSEKTSIEGCEDRWHAESHAGRKRGVLICNRQLYRWLSQDNSSTQRTDFGLRAVKTYDNAKSRAGEKISLECLTRGYTGGHHLDKWLAHSG